MTMGAILHVFSVVSPNPQAVLPLGSLRQCGVSMRTSKQRRRAPAKPVRRASHPTQRQRVDVLADNSVAHAPDEPVVLIVEDDEIVRQGLSIALAAQGYSVLTAGDGEEALEVAAQHREPIDLVVTDL